jgi:hypothetical protein
MIHEEINENNKLIADFMGVKNVFKYILHTGTFVGYYIAENEDGKIDYDDGVNFLKYNSCFNYLIPVIDKISKVVIKGNPPFNNDQYVRVEIVPNGYVKISNLRDSPITTNISIEGNLINAIYKAVVLFIKWYNKRENDRKDIVCSDMV